VVINGKYSKSRGYLGVAKENGESRQTEIKKTKVDAEGRGVAHSIAGVKSQIISAPTFFGGWFFSLFLLLYNVDSGRGVAKKATNKFLVGCRKT